MLKVSGEALMGNREYGLDTATCRRIAEDVRGVVELGVQVCLVIGGGNIFRGIAGAAAGMDRSQADYMGMLATVMNALAMQNALEQIGVETRVQSAIQMDEVFEPVMRRRAERHLEKGRIVIFAAGVGSPYFTTDSGACVLRDLMPVLAEGAKRRVLLAEHEVLRGVEGLTGEVELEVLYEPRPHFARNVPRLRQRGLLGIYCETSAAALILRAEVELEIVRVIDTPDATHIRYRVG